MDTADNLTDAVIFGKIMLDKSTLEISFICNFCERIQATFPELIRHVLSEHNEDVTMVKLEKLCGVEAKAEIHVGPDVCDMIMKDIIDRQEQEEMDEEILRHFMNKASANDNEYIKTEIRTTPIEINDYIDGNGSKSDADGDPSNSNFKPQRDNPDLEPTADSPGRLCVVKLLQCKKCDAKFRRPKQLREHKQKEHSARKTGFICKECGKVFSCHSSIATHKLRHRGIKRHVCTICDKAFITTSEHSLHMRRHTGERPYKCSYCDKDFICSGELTTHTRTHTKEQSHLCSICGMKLKSPAGLKKHLTTHSSERPHKCSQCNWSFKNRDGLREHGLTHSVAKKHACQFCEKSFVKQKRLLSHIEHAHNRELNIVN